MVKKYIPKYIPRRGDIIWINFDPVLGKEIKKRRPALVLSPLAYNSLIRLAVLCPITSKIKSFPFEVELKLPKVKGAVLCDQIKSMDYIVRNPKFICKAPDAIMQEVQAKILPLILDS